MISMRRMATAIIRPLSRVSEDDFWRRWAGAAGRSENSAKIGWQEGWGGNTIGPSRGLRASRRRRPGTRAPHFGTDLLYAGAATTLGVGTMFTPRPLVAGSLAAAALAVVVATNLPGGERGQEAGAPSPRTSAEKTVALKTVALKTVALKTPRLDQFDKYYA